MQTTVTTSGEIDKLSQELERVHGTDAKLRKPVPLSTTERGQRQLEEERILQFVNSGPHSSHHKPNNVSSDQKSIIGSIGNTTAGRQR
jgi:hypothetical protein